METKQRKQITVETAINAPIQKVWKFWTQPGHITKWNFASDDWHSPSAKNDLRPGGEFNFRMEAKDGSFGFDFGGRYDSIDTEKRIAYTLGDGRKVAVHFHADGDRSRVTETFEAEDQNPLDMQRGGWQAILDNFRKYTESN
jgi:uncharacterized protein YndB with AHSA1/START domain